MEWPARVGIASDSKESTHCFWVWLDRHVYDCGGGVGVGVDRGARHGGGGIYTLWRCQKRAKIDLHERRAGTRCGYIPSESGQSPLPSSAFLRHTHHLTQYCPPYRPLLKHLPNMPRATKPSGKSRHDPLHVQLRQDEVTAKYGKVSNPTKRSKASKRSHGDEENDEV